MVLKVKKNRQELWGIKEVKIQESKHFRESRQKKKV